MAIFYQLTIQPHTRCIEIPINSPVQAVVPYPIKACLTLKPAGDMAFSKRKEIPCRREFFKHQHIDESRVYSLYQEHTKRVVNVEKKKKPEAYHNISGDGMITAEKDILLSVTVADCLPIFLLDKQTGAYGIVHSGWKGTGIILKAIKLMEKEYRTKRRDLKVVIGPGIGPCCYHVPEKRYKRFASRFGISSCIEESGKFYLDLKKANLFLLEKEDITDIDVIENCTFCNSLMHSFRRDGRDNFGVMLAIIGYIPA